MNKRRIVNKGVIYTGKLGSKMRMKSPPRTPKIVIKHCVKLSDGPMRGFSLWLTRTVENVRKPNSWHSKEWASTSTLPFIYKGQAGRYIEGRWQAS